MVTASKTRTYTVLRIPGEQGGYSIEVPALPGRFTHGATLEQARRRAKEAIEVHVAGLEADGEPAPQETERPSLTLVTI